MFSQLSSKHSNIKMSPINEISSVFRCSLCVCITCGLYISCVLPKSLSTNVTLLHIQRITLVELKKTESISLEERGTQEKLYKNGKILFCNSNDMPSRPKTGKDKDDDDDDDDDDDCYNWPDLNNFW
jgi:hypothetical protein